MKAKILVLSIITLILGFFITKSLLETDKEIVPLEITNTPDSLEFSCAQLGDSINVLPMGFIQKRGTNTPKTIPVVVHVVYTDSIPGSYIDPNVIPVAINQLNVDFEGTDID